jgi:hypothetical protein
VLQVGGKLTCSAPPSGSWLPQADNEIRVRNATKPGKVMPKGACNNDCDPLLCHEYGCITIAQIF